MNEDRSGAPRREADQAAFEVASWIRNIKWGRLLMGAIISLVLAVSGGALGFWLSFQDLKAQSGNAVTMASTAVSEVKRVEDTVRAVRDNLNVKLNWSVALIEALALDACRRTRARMREAGVPCEELEIPRELMRRP